MTKQKHIPSSNIHNQSSNSNKKMSEREYHKKVDKILTEKSEKEINEIDKDYYLLSISLIFQIICTMPLEMNFLLAFFPSIK